MNRPVTTAVLLVALLGIAGCFGAVDPVEEEQINDPVVLEAPLIEWSAPIETIQLDGTPIVLQVRYSGEGWDLMPSVLNPDYEALSAYGWSSSPIGYALEFIPSMLGTYTIAVGIEAVDSLALAPEVADLTHEIVVTPPTELAPIIQAPSREMLEEPNLL